MKSTAAGLVLLLTLGGCSSAQLEPAKMPDAGQFQAYDARTKFAVRDTGQSSAYLVIRYSKYSFLDRSSDEIPVAQTKFRNIAKKIALEKGFDTASYEDEGFDMSTGYNGITGVSSVVLGNEISFR